MPQLARLSPKKPTHVIVIDCQGVCPNWPDCLQKKDPLTSLSLIAKACAPTSQAVLKKPTHVIVIDLQGVPRLPRLSKKKTPTHVIVLDLQGVPQLARLSHKKKRPLTSLSLIVKACAPTSQAVTKKFFF